VIRPAHPGEDGRPLAVLFLALSAALAAAFAGCAEAKAKHPGIVKIGVILPMSGSLADKGRDSYSGIELSIAEVNAAGGIAAMGGAKFEAVLLDSMGDPAAGREATRRLAADTNVAAIIGSYQSSVTKVATQEAEALRIPFIVCISIADIITERGFRYTFRLQPKAAFYGRDQASFLVDLESLAGLRVRRVALIHENTDFGTSSALAQKRELFERGIDVVAEESYIAERVEGLEPEIRRILEAKPEAILEVTYLRDSILIRRALAAAGSSIPLLDLAGGTVSPEYRRELGSLAELTFSVSEYCLVSEDDRRLNERFRARFGTDITGDSAYAYQSVLVLKDAFERAASLDRGKLREALASTDMPKGPSMILPAERLRFDAQGQNETARLYIVQIQDGEWLPVWPAGDFARPPRLR